jgi:uncharacterized protein
MTNKFLAGLMALAFCFIIALPANAQDTLTPEKKALIKELLTLMNASGNSEAVANQIMEALQAPVANALSNEMRGWIREQKLPPAEQKRLEAETDESAQRILTRLRAEIPKRISFGELVEKVAIETYDKYFTEAEVKDLIAFYKTSTGQKFVKILPQLTADLMSGTGKLIEPELTKLMTETLADELMRLKTKRN